MFCATALLAQTQNNVFRVHFSVIDATCYNNGKVTYELTDSQGGILEELPPGITNVRIYYKQSGSDSVHYAGWYYSGGTDTLNLNHGTYSVGVEALLSDGNEGFIKVDTETTLTVSTSYLRPTAAVVPLTANSREQAGNLFTVSCIDVGRVQLNIEDGRLPYKVVILNNVTGDTLRTEVFQERQYHGTNLNRFDYQDYYSIDSLPGGNLAFFVEDGCGYGLPKIEQKVIVKSLPRPSFVYSWTSSDNFTDSNVIKLTLEYSSGSILGLRDILQQHAKFRFTYGNLGTSEWKRLPDEMVNGNCYLIYDTIHAAKSYCDIWDKPIAFEYQIEDCGDTSYYLRLNYYKPDDKFFEKSSIAITDSVVNDKASCSRITHWHRDAHTISYHSSDYTPTYRPFGRNDNAKCHAYHRYYYTHPLTWIYTDIETGQVIKRDTVANIASKSLLRLEEINDIYGPSEENHLLNIERKLLDAKGCVLHVSVDTLDFSHCSSRSTIRWNLKSDFDPEDNCCSTPRTIILSSPREQVNWPDSTVIKLNRSPYNNLYNFEALYIAHEQRWEIQKDSLSNQAAITGSPNGHRLVISDYCLPSGPYVFDIQNACINIQLSENLSFPDLYELKVIQNEPPTIVQDCHNITIYYYNNKFQRLKHNTSVTTGLPLPPVVANVPACARVIQKPSNATQMSISYFHNIDKGITFSMPGTYVMEVGPNLYEEACEAFAGRYDTIVFDNSTVEFVDVRAILCDTLSTSGNVWVQSTSGIKPYVFTLFDQPDKTGNILGSNNTGIFLDVPMSSNQTLSCLVQDSCNAYFHINFQPSTIANLQKVWFEDRMSATTACEGTVIQAHALALDNIFQYEWTGPNDFHATTSDPYILVPHGLSNGWYKVTLRESTCGEEITDSIFLTILPAPEISLSPDTTVCPGEATIVRFTPHSDSGSDEISFSIAFENESGVETRQYAALSGSTVMDTFTTLTRAKIYPVAINDGRCNQLADQADTLVINLRTDITPNCGTLTTHDTVCVGGDARLTAMATLEPPYTLNWYGDYALSRQLKSELITEEGQQSVYDTARLQHRAILFVSLQQGDACPSVNGLITNSINMHEGTTSLSCGEKYRVYDSGGPDSSAMLSGRITHHFRSSDGTPLSISFDQLQLSPTDHLLILSGDTITADSLLCDLTQNSQVPCHFQSEGGTLTLCHFGQDTQFSDWKAIVESSPGMAVAEVKTKDIKNLYDEVCQSQTNNYEDCCHITPNPASAAELNMAIRHAGNYYYSTTIANSSGCDSTVNFTLTVNAPPTTETKVTTTRQKGFLWHDSLYREGGKYVHLNTLPDGCDQLDILTLNILDVTCDGVDICAGDTAPLSISASLYSEFHTDSLLTKNTKIGDILCTDGSILPVDSFLISNRNPKGVVFYMDQSGTHGLAIALSESSGVLSNTPLFNIMAETAKTPSQASRDYEGRINTLGYIATCDQLHTTNNSADITAFHFCHYYNHETLMPDQEPHGWYLPAAGEMFILSGNICEINQTLMKMNASNSSYKKMNSPSYWTSTPFSNSDGWSFSNFANRYNRLMKYGIRPITSF